MSSGSLVCGCRARGSALSLEIGLSLSMDPSIRTRLLNSGLPPVELESVSTVDVSYVVFNPIHAWSVPVKEQFQVPDFQAGLIELQDLSIMKNVHAFGSLTLRRQGSCILTPMATRQCRMLCLLPLNGSGLAAKDMW